MNLPVKSILAFYLIFGLGCRQDGASTDSESAAPDSSMMIQSEEAQREAVLVLPAPTYAQRKGKRLYDHYCAVCHGVEGKGDGFNAYNLDPRPKDMTEESYLKAVTDDWLMEAISQGGRGVKRSILMPSYENTLSKSQIADIVAYLHAFRK